MRNTNGTMVEADVEVNGVPLDFAQSMTLRVALSSFLMCCSARDSSLGEIGKLYAARCREMLDVIHGGIVKQNGPCG